MILYSRILELGSEYAGTVGMDTTSGGYGGGEVAWIQYSKKAYGHNGNGYGYNGKE